MPRCSFRCPGYFTIVFTLLVVAWLASTTQAQAPASKTLVNSIGMEFRLIPAGTFMMGSLNGEADEQPVHQVTISKPFYLGKYEVTQGQWQAVMGNNPSFFIGNPKLPVESVPQPDVQEFIHRLNAKEGGDRYRLPTEAEWEYAARAGSTTDYSFGNDATRLSEFAWYKANSNEQTHPVGQLKPNAWGLYDIHGNVWEWVQDWYGRYTSEAVTDPKGATKGTHRLRRGCGWNNVSQICRSANRYSVVGFRDDFLGFRLLRTIP
ncbi:Hercynine oxygenase [Candidatus Entotheonellaceae bacterium PAL068K]